MISHFLQYQQEWKIEEMLDFLDQMRGVCLQEPSRHLVLKVNSKKMATKSIASRVFFLWNEISLFVAKRHTIRTHSTSRWCADIFVRVLQLVFYFWICACAHTDNTGCMFSAFQCTKAEPKIAKRNWKEAIASEGQASDVHRNFCF